MTGIFGGSFDPIHSGHIILAEDLIEKGIFKQIIFVPANVPPLKNHIPEASFDHRIEMIKRAILAFAKMKVSDIEKDTDVSYTVDTIKKISKKINNIALIIGTDQAYKFSEWRSPGEILNLVPVYVLSRKAKEVPDNVYTQRFNLLDTRIIEISSSEIRQRIKNGESIHLFVPELVEEYIQKNHLYR